MITDGLTAVQAFEAGEIVVLYQGLPVDEISRLKETPEYDQYEGLGARTTTASTSRTSPTSNSARRCRWPSTAAR